MWSGPRNLSTALMRSFENRSDTAVIDEPFYAHYLLNTGLKHPGHNEIINSQSNDWNEIVKLCIGPIPSGKSIWYQKHMAQHNLSGYDISWITRIKNCILIRNPKYVISSYSKQYPVEYNERLLGYVQQIEIIEYLSEVNKEIPLIIDASDILKKPKQTLKKLCKTIGIDFSKDMLSWPRGSRKTDGVWGSYWYSRVNKSTGFEVLKNKEIKFDRNLIPLYKKCMKHYTFMYKNRLKV